MFSFGVPEIKTGGKISYKIYTFPPLGSTDELRDLNKQSGFIVYSTSGQKQKRKLTELMTDSLNNT